MLGGVQVIPFHRPPKKRWEPGAEKKKRLVIDLSKDEDEDIEDETFSADYDDDSESSEESEEGFNMQKHIEDLLPGDLVDGMKPTKAANATHLEDLRAVHKKVDRFSIFKSFYRFIKRVRARERERRKHYILKEWEAKIKQYDENQKQAILDKMEAHKKEVLLEKYRSAQRRIRNSRKVLITLIRVDLELSSAPGVLTFCVTLIFVIALLCRKRRNLRTSLSSRLTLTVETKRPGR